MRKFKRGPNDETVEKTIKLLNLCIDEAKKPKFIPTDVARKLRTSNSTFYSAVKLGYFVRNLNGSYNSTVENYTEKEAFEVLNLNGDLQFQAKQRKQIIDTMNIVDVQKPKRIKLFDSDNKPSKSMEKLIKKIDMVNVEEIMLTEQSAVSLLKSLGYKILKPKTDWEEL